MFIPFDQLPDNARVWVYPSSRKFTPDELLVIRQKTEALIALAPSDPNVQSLLLSINESLEKEGITVPNTSKPEKNNQENLLNQLDDVSIKIYRPKALSYGKTLLNSISRKNLAEIILHDIHKLYN